MNRSGRAVLIGLAITLRYCGDGDDSGGAARVLPLNFSQ